MIRTVVADIFFQEYSKPLFSGYERERQQVQGIIADVRNRGDIALRDYTLRFDGVELKGIEVAEEEISQGENQIDKDLRVAVQAACQNVENYHRSQLPKSYWQPEKGKMLGSISRPYDRVGVYVPGGTAGYPSSVFMTVVPARVAGVKEVVVCTPPAPDGSVNPLTLYAARQAGASAVCRVGGAQAIAAMAYGTESIKPVQVIAGPGNIYVTLAKKEVYGDVGIDMLAGPSEIMVVAGDDATATYIAADLLSQAEHDIMSRVFLVTTSTLLAEDVTKELEKQIIDLPRRDMAEKCVRANGWIVIVDNLERAWDVVNLVAPEHLEIMLPNPWIYLDEVKNAGSIFLGEYSPEPLADYMAGLNHVLPTGGAASFSSPLGVHNFMKYSQVMAYGPDALAKEAPHVLKLSRVEGLEAHARAVEIRLQDMK